MINELLNSFVWGKAMICFLLMTGAFLFLRTNCFLIFHIRLIYQKTIKKLFQKQSKSHGVTSFQAVSTALAGTLGVGSVIGVATALTIGGAGALFWMWISALLGMMTKFAEVVLAIYFRQRQSDGSYLGGPMTTLEYGCHMKLLGVIFALLCIFASFGIGNLTPANTIAMSILSYVDIHPIWIGIILAIMVASIIWGSAKRIMKFNEIAIPLISILYLAACIYLLIIHSDRIVSAIVLVINDAFSFTAGIGGVGGFAITKAMHYGISRGVFSHEAGMGSSPISHAAVVDVHPVEQGFWGIFEVFFDTVVVCTLTALVILTSGLLNQGMDGVALVIACFEQGFGTFGGVLFAISIVAFALPSILGWYYYAEECIRYLFTWNRVLRCYQIVFLCLLIMGTLMDLHYVWEIADTLNGLMSIPNLISLVILHGIVVKLTKEYVKHNRSD